MRKIALNLLGIAVVTALSLGTVVVSTSAVAQDKVQDQTMDKDQLKEKDQLRDKDQLKDTVYGSQLMTQAERNAYHAKMRMLKTAQEREQYRLQHHELMQERARAKGVTLPEMPLIKGPGAGMGNAAGGAGGKK